MLTFLGEHRLASGSEEGKMVIWDLSTMESEAVVQLEGQVTGLVLCGDKLFVSTTSYIALLDPNEGFALIGTLPLPSQALVCSPHGLIVAAGEHLHVFSQESLEMRPCICCRNKNTQPKLPPQYTYLAASERYLVAANDFTHIALYDFLPQ